MMLGFKAIFPEICILTCSLNTVHPYTESCLFVHIDMYRLEEGVHWCMQKRCTVCIFYYKFGFLIPFTIKDCFRLDYWLRFTY